MSRTYRDKPGGHTSSQYGITHEGVSVFKRMCRRITRHRVKQTLHKGEEPHPKYPHEYWYWD